MKKLKLVKRKYPVSRWIKIYLNLICCDTMTRLCAWEHSATLMALCRSTHKNIRCITCFNKHTRRKLLLVSKSALLMSLTGNATFLYLKMGKRLVYIIGLYSTSVILVSLFVANSVYLSKGVLRIDRHILKCLKVILANLYR